MFSHENSIATFLDSAVLSYNFSDEFVKCLVKGGHFHFKVSLLKERNVCQGTVKILMIRHFV
jgi:hypothetical protein